MITIQVNGDGGSWSANYGDIVDPQASPVGYGTTPKDAVAHLMEEEDPLHHEDGVYTDEEWKIFHSGRRQYYESIDDPDTMSEPERSRAEDAVHQAGKAAVEASRLRPALEYTVPVV